jgi:very-short-patch-repair endonuclease
LPPEHIAIDLGVPITSAARTTVDLMREGTITDALIAADGALHLGVTHEELEHVVAFCSSWVGGHQATEVLNFADGRAESAAESLARWVCAQDEKLPPAELQVELYDAFGLIGRVDLFFRAFRVILEVDGYIKYTDPWCGDAEEALRQQHAREARLRTAGWTVVRTTWEELTTDPLGLIRRLLAAIATSR